MAASDACWPPVKNAAWRVYFPLLDADGDLVPNGASDTPDSERSIDGGTFADCSNEMTEIATNSGMYYLDLNASEMNGDCIAIISKTATAGTKTTPIVVYPVTGNFDSVTSDIALIDAAIDSDHTITMSDVAAVSTKIDSDVVDTDAKLDSDMTLLLADHDKTQSDIALLDAAVDSDSALYLADHDKTQSDIALLSNKADSDQVISLSDIAAISTKIDSDAVLADADHDKTQSDIALLSTKVDSDSTLYLADHDKTQSDIAILTATDGVKLGTSQPAAWSGLEASVSTIAEGVAEAGTLSTTQMTTDLTEATDDHYNGRTIIWTSGVLIGQATDITDYTGATGMLTYTAVTEAPSADDTFVIV